MSRIPIFYSFHFNNDVMRVQQVRNIGTIQGNTPTSPNEWETIKRNGDQAIKNWIDQNMRYKRCIVVLIGEDTSTRPWVRYEIEKAWNERKAIIGIHIHNLKCPRTGISRKGVNPFTTFGFTRNGRSMGSLISCYDPNSLNPYGQISTNIAGWIDTAIARGTS